MPGGGRRACALLLALLLSTSPAVGPQALAQGTGDDSAAVQQAEEHPAANEDRAPQPATAPAVPAGSSAPSAAPGVCEALATAAAANDLPLDVFTRLIWQESRFQPDAISRKGAQGIAQFMPATAKSNGLDNPFDPLQAIAKSAQLLRDLRREFGNLGLAAAAYNAGSGRVHDWLGGRRPLPPETRAYVHVVTGRAVGEWAGRQAGPVVTTAVETPRCDLPATASIRPKPDASVPSPERIKAWGVEVVGGPTPALALARYREWRSKYAALVADREPHVVMRGIAGAMGAARVRLGEDTRAGADKLCAALRAAGTYCDVLRN